MIAGDEEAVTATLAKGAPQLTPSTSALTAQKQNSALVEQVGGSKRDHDDPEKELKPTKNRTSSTPAHSAPQ